MNRIDLKIILNANYWKKATITTTKHNTEKFIGTYTDITVQEILEVRHSQFEILTDNLSLFKLLMLDGREFHRFVSEYRKVVLKYSIVGLNQLLFVISW